MRVLVTGGAGLLGQALIATSPAGVELHATRRTRPVTGAQEHVVELANPDAVLALCRRLRIERIVHTAYSAGAPERDIDAATRSVVGAAVQLGADLIHMSTDALLDGESAPYAEHAEPAPVHEYGRWKARAELHVREGMPGAAIIRTSLITCFSPLDPRSAWVADSLRDGNPVTLYTDELRCPISPQDLARQIWELTGLPAPERSGVWHLAGPEALSRYSLGVLIAATQGLDPAGITPARSASSGVRRPRDLRLLTGRADAKLAHRARPIGELAAAVRR